MILGIFLGCFLKSIMLLVLWRKIYDINRNIKYTNFFFHRQIFAHSHEKARKLVQDNFMASARKCFKKLLKNWGFQDYFCSGCTKNSMRELGTNKTSDDFQLPNIFKKKKFYTWRTKCLKMIQVRISSVIFIITVSKIIG